MELIDMADSLSSRVREITVKIEPDYVIVKAERPLSGLPQESSVRYPIEEILSTRENYKYDGSFKISTLKAGIVTSEDEKQDCSDDIEPNYDTIVESFSNTLQEDLANGIVALEGELFDVESHVKNEVAITGEHDMDTTMLSTGLVLDVVEPKEPTMFQSDVKIKYKDMPDELHVMSVEYTQPGDTALKECSVVLTPSPDITYPSRHPQTVIKHKYSGDRPFKCDNCNYAGKHIRTLNRHKKIHSGEKPFHCDECSFSCYQQCGLSSHKLIHSNEKPFSCDKCDFSCKQLGGLNSHKRIHSDVKSFQCDKCSFTCKQPSSLKSHKMIHSDNKPFQCDKCSFTSKRLSALSNHKLLHSDEKTYKCDYCNYTCKQPSTLNSHKKCHSEEKPYKCDACNYTCKTARSLRSHRQSHSGERPYQCDKCSYTCKRSNHLKSHKLIHSEEKSFKCDKCTYTCKQQYRLNSHKRDLHQITLRNIDSIDSLNCNLIHTEEKAVESIPETFIIIPSVIPVQVTTSFYVYI